MKRLLGWGLVTFGTIATLPLRQAAAGTTPLACVGDCAGDATLTIDDLMVGVRIALGAAGVDTCASSIATATESSTSASYCRE